MRFIPETTRGVKNQVTTRSLVSSDVFWEELKLDTATTPDETPTEPGGSGDDGEL